jgi:hypothetical protein
MPSRRASEVWPGATSTCSTLLARSGRSACERSNSIDPDVFRHDSQQRGLLRAELGIGDDEVIVAVVGRVDPMKDWRTMREALRDLPGVVTVAIGKGTDELPPQTGFIGLGWRDDVVRILSAADIFQTGRTTDTVGQACTDSVYRATPAIGTAHGSHPRQESYVARVKTWRWLT